MIAPTMIPNLTPTTTTSPPEGASAGVDVRTPALSMTEDERSAWHEAGHVIMAQLLKWPVTTVTISLEHLPEGQLGRCELVRLRATSASRQQRLRAHLLVSWAGVSAEWVASGGSEPDWENATSDMEDVAELVELLHPCDEDGADLTADWAYACARGLLGTPLARAALEAVARALLEEHTLDGVRLMAIISQACEPYGVSLARGGLTANRVLSSLMLAAEK